MMLKWFSALPLRKKVIYPIWILLTLSSMVLGASVAHFIGVTHSANLYTRTSILAQGIASNLSGALIFDDQQTGLDQMKALSFDPEVIAACVKDINQNAFAILDQLPKNCLWVGQNIQCSQSVFFAITHAITLDNEHLGELTVWASKDSIFDLRNKILAIFVFTTVILSALALFFAHGLHLLISMPLLSMFSSMQSVIKKGVTEQRLHIVHPDEIGNLTHCFNEMLDNLSHRDSQLIHAFQKLEDKTHYINQVLDSLEQGLLVVSPNKDIIYHNPAARLLLPQIQLNNEEMSILNRQEVEHLLSDFEPAHRLTQLRECVESHVRLDPITLRNQTTGQQYQVSTYPIAGERNSLIHIEDISQRYLIEQRQRMAEMIFDQNPSSVIVVTRTMNIETKNNAFIQTFGNITCLTQLCLRQPLAFSASVLKQVLTLGYFKQHIEVKSQCHLTSNDNEHHWLPCLLTIKTIKNSDNKVESFVISISDQTQVRELKRLSFEANHDALTQLANRKNAYNQLANAHKNHTSLYLIFLDLDGFKAVNDTYGHQCGDDLLKIVAQRLSNSVLESDLVSRLAGDEFLLGLFLPTKPLVGHDIRTILQRILNAIAQPIHINGCTPVVSASIGVYHWTGDDPLSLDDALEKADKAMYKAKLSGKNRYHIAE